MFALCNSSPLSLSAQWVHTHGFQLALFSLNAFKYHLKLDISIALVYLNAQWVHTHGFWLALVSLSASKYHLKLDIPIALVYLNA
jgi:hypothetical protein